VIGLAVTFVMLAGVFQLVDCGQVVAMGMLRGLHDTRVPMLFAAVGYWLVGLPLGVLLAFPLGLHGIGIWIGLAAGLAVVALLLSLRWMARHRLGLVPPAM
jgi:MATE family multidrug resistance protein